MTFPGDPADCSPHEPLVVSAGTLQRAVCKRCATPWDSSQSDLPEEIRSAFELAAQMRGESGVGR
jgi:hypothetical protein